MRIKTNLRAGKDGTADGTGRDPNQKPRSPEPDVPEVDEVDPPEVYVPPVSRCAGL